MLAEYSGAGALFYDHYAPGVAGDVAFYVERARAAGSAVLEVGCGTGRILIPMAEADVDVRVVEDRLEADDDHVEVDDLLREAEHEDRREHEDARGEELEDVLPRSGEPVHVLGAVVHRVEAP